MDTTPAIRLRSEVLHLLENHGYIHLPQEVTIGDVQLLIPYLLEGPSESLDLSLVSDRPDSRESALRLYWLVQRLVRALDAAGSRRTVTVVLIGQSSGQAGLNDLQELSRVLVVDGSLPTDRMIGPLLKLRLPVTAIEQSDGIAEVSESISHKHFAHDLSRLVQAATSSANAVSDRYRGWIDEAFVKGGSSHG